MSTFLQTSDQDMALVNGRLVLISDGRAIAQKTECDFRFFLGEWFADVTQGIPWLTRVMVKNPDMVMVQQLFKKVILNNPSISSLDAFTIAYDPPTRKFTYSFTATSTTGQQIVGGDTQLRVT